MAATKFHTRAYGDESVVRANLNVTNSSLAVIRKVVVGSGIAFSSTGVDTGTGDVTISISPITQGLNNFGLYRSFK